MTASILFRNIHSSILKISSDFPNQKEDAKFCKLKRHPYAFDDLLVVKALKRAKVSVYLVQSKVNNQRYAMKVFPDDHESKLHIYFQNEVRFCFVNHPNVIKTHHIEYEKEQIPGLYSGQVSYIITEYAPYGDFFDFITKFRQNVDEKLIRTYFRQLIEGLEYLHKNGVSHLDLKLENLLLGQDFQLKIADFDISHFAGDEKIISKGTKFYRCPELIAGTCTDTQAADIYSAGIVLFALKTGGILPHAEDSLVDDIDFAALLYADNSEFWQKHCEFQKKGSSFFDEDFKELFNRMIQLNPRDRPNIEQIKNSKWYNGPFYSSEELQAGVGIKLYKK